MKMEKNPKSASEHKPKRKYIAPAITKLNDVNHGYSFRFKIQPPGGPPGVPGPVMKSPSVPGRVVF